MNFFKLSRFGVRKKDPALDVKFYRDYYADLSHATDDEINRHWEEFGRAEGRFGSEAQARQAAAASQGLPKDFDVATYLRLNPDVAATVKWDFQAVFHYLEHGKAERRPYAGSPLAAVNVLPRGFNLASYIVCNPDIARVIASNAERLKHYFDHGRAEGRNGTPLHYDAAFVAQLYDVRIPQGLPPEEAVVAVKQLLKPADDQIIYFSEDEAARFHGINIPYFSRYFDHDFYRYKYLKDAGKFFNRAECIRHFCETGQHEQFDISLDGAFDDAFFRAEHESEGTTAESSRQDRYRRWLRSDADEPLWPNLKVLVQQIYGAKLPRAVEAAVAARLASGADRSEPVKPSRVVKDLLAWTLDLDDPAAAGFFVDVADKRATQGKDVEAAELYARALIHAPGHPRALNHRADMVQRGGNLALATALRRHIVALDASNEWTFRHLAQGLLELGEPKAAERIMAAGVKKYPGDVGLRLSLREIQEKFFYDVWEKSADVALREGYDEARARVTNAARRLARDEERPVVGASPVRRVAVYANCDLAQCRFYRVDQRAEQIAAAGYEVTVYDYTKDHDKYMSDLMQIDYTIFYRVPAFPTSSMPFPRRPNSASSRSTTSTIWCSIRTTFHRGSKAMPA